MRRGRRLLLLAGVVLLALNLRPGIIVVSPLLPQIRADLGMSSAVAGVLGAIPPVAFAVFGAVTPRVVRAVGLERLAWLSVLLTSSAQVVRPFSVEPWMFLALSSLAYAGMGAGNVLLPPLVKRHFPDRIGTVSAVYILLISVGTVLPALTAVPAADVTGWRTSLAAWGALALVAVWPWVRADRRLRGDTEPAEEIPSSYLPVVRLVRSPLAWGLAAVFGVNSMSAYAMFTWLPTMLSESGIGARESGLYLSLFAAVALPAAFIVPWATVRIRTPVPLIVGFAACYAAGFAGLLLAPTSGTAVWVALAGLGPGAFPLTLTLVNLRSATVPGAAALSGFTQGVGYAVAGLGPFLAGLLREVSGNWRSALLLLLTVQLLQLVAAAAVSRPGTLEQTLRRGRP